MHEFEIGINIYADCKHRWEYFQTSPVHKYGGHDCSIFNKKQLISYLRHHYPNCRIIDRKTKKVYRKGHCQ